MKLLQQTRQLALHGRCDEEIKLVTREQVMGLNKRDFSILHEIMVGPHVGLALVALQNAGFFEWLIPEVRKSLELKSYKSFKEIWPHTIRVVQQAPAKLSVRWAALFHDLGKAQSFEVKDGKVTFHHHEKISAKIFDKFAKKTRIFTDGQRHCIHFLVSNLGYVESYENEWTDSAVRRFNKEMGIYLDDLLTLSRSDITTANQKKRDRILRRIDTLKARIQEIVEKDSKKSGLPKGLGNEISAQLGIPIGPEIGDIRKDLELKIENGQLKADEEFEYYIHYLKENYEHRK